VHRPETNQRVLKLGTCPDFWRAPPGSNGAPGGGAGRPGQYMCSACDGALDALIPKATADAHCYRVRLGAGFVVAIVAAGHFLSTRFLWAARDSRVRPILRLGCVLSGRQPRAARLSPTRRFRLKTGGPKALKNSVPPTLRVVPSRRKTDGTTRVLKSPPDGPMTRTTGTPKPCGTLAYLVLTLQFCWPGALQYSE